MMRTTRILLGTLVAAAAISGCGNTPTTETLVRRAIADFQVGRVDRAESQLRQGLDQTPSDPYALFYMGRICHAQGRYEQASYYYRCCLDADPAFADVAEKYLLDARKHIRPPETALHPTP